MPINQKLINTTLSLIQKNQLKALQRVHGLTVPSSSNLFRTLTGKEEEAVSIMDNRDVFGEYAAPNNDVLIVCDHASHDLKFIKPLDSEDTLVRSN